MGTLPLNRMLSKEIFSLQHPFVKEAIKIRSDKSFRYEKQKLLIVGEKAISEIENRYSIDVLIYLKPFEHIKVAKEEIRVTEEIMKKISGVSSPQNVCAIVPMPSLDQDFFEAPRILVLDQISDPGNMGTLIRTALAFGWDGIIFTENSVDPFNDKALRASLGASLLIPLAKKTEKEIVALSRLYNKKIFLADLKGQKLSSLSIPSSFFLVLSNEAHGLKWNEEGITLTIPMVDNNIESLNVAVAGAILMYEMSGIK